MDPRIGWHPNELISEAYSTWTNVWMIAQMNCTTTSTNNTTQSSSQLHAAHSQSCNINTRSDTNNKTITNDTLSDSKIIDNKIMALIDSATCTCNNNTSSTNLNQLDYQQGYPNNQNSSVTSQTILNGLKSRKFNKASTFGFNFPINQHVLGKIS